MKKLYTFSEESVKRAQAALTLGFDTIGKEAIPVAGGKFHVHAVFMRNVRHRVYLDKNFFPEIEPGEEIDVKYIINHETVNNLYREGGLLHYAFEGS